MKRKGFTLIELLAVIVVLAIIALIATPIVMNVIKKANMGAAERSADNYVKAVETLIATEKLDGTPLVDGTYTIDSTGKLTKDGKEYEVEVSGTKPVDGTITIRNGQVVKDTTTAIEYKDYTVTFENGVAKAEEAGKLMTLADCDYVPGEKEEKEVGAKYTCDLGDGERTFYVLETGKNPITNSTLKSNEVALILETNYDDTTQAWCKTGSNTSCNADGLTAKLNEISEVWTKLDRIQIGIPSLYQITNADERIADGNIFLSNSWLYNNLDNDSSTNYVEGYWVNTVDDGGCAFYISYGGVIQSEDAAWGFDYGVRPIIILEA